MALVGLLVAVTFSSNLPLIGMNDASRWATVESLVHRATYEITDSTFVDTVDRVVIQKKSGGVGYYSSKPAFMATWVAAVAWPLDQMGLSILRPDMRTTAWTIHTILFLVNLLPFIFCLWGYWLYLGKEGFNGWATGVSILAAAFGTYMTGYLTTLSNHVTGAECVFGAALLYRAHAPDVPLSARRTTAIALLAGLAVAHEAAAFLFAAVLIAKIFKRAPKGGILAIAIAALPIAAYFLTERLSFGDWIPHQVSVMFGIPASYGMDPYWADVKGIDATKDSLPWRAWHMTFGHHGIFSLSPIFLLGLAPLFTRRLTGPFSEDRVTYIQIFVISLSCFAVFCVETTNYGGVCQGFRWLFWLIPLWLMILPHTLSDPATNRRLARVATAAALLVSIGSALSSLANPWGPSWLHLLMTGHSIW